MGFLGPRPKSSCCPLCRNQGGVTPFPCAVSPQVAPVAAELGDVLVAPRCPGGEYSLIPSLCTSLLGSSNSKTPNAPQMSHFTLGVSRGVFPSWDCHCPPPHVAPVPMLFPMAVHLLGCCRTGVVCICCSACGVLAAILLLLTGLHQLQCTEGLCSPPPFLATGLHSPCCTQWGFAPIHCS